MFALRLWVTLFLDILRACSSPSRWQCFPFVRTSWALVIDTWTTSCLITYDWLFMSGRRGNTV